MKIRHTHTYQNSSVMIETAVNRNPPTKDHCPSANVAAPLFTLYPCAVYMRVTYHDATWFVLQIRSFPSFCGRNKRGKNHEKDILSYLVRYQQRHMYGLVTPILEFCTIHFCVEVLLWVWSDLPLPKRPLCWSNDLCTNANLGYC